MSKLMKAGRNTATARRCSRSPVALLPQDGWRGHGLRADLAKLDLKVNAGNLKDIIEPSHKINEKYQTWVIETKAGKTYTGLILDETPKQIKLIENLSSKRNRS